MELERTVERELSFCFSIMHQSIPVVKKRSYNFSASPTDRWQGRFFVDRYLD